MSDLIAITYDDQDSGRQAFERLDYLQKMQLLTLEDAAFAYKDEKGKVKVTQTLEKAHTGSTASWGFFWGLLIGLIFGGPLFWGLTTALIGALTMHVTDAPCFMVAVVLRSPLPATTPMTALPESGW